MPFCTLFPNWSLPLQVTISLVPVSILFINLPEILYISISFGLESGDFCKNCIVLAKGFGAILNIGLFNCKSCSVDDVEDKSIVN